MKINAPVLVIEDDPDGQELVARMLRRINIQTEIAGTAEDAWRMLKTKQYAGAVIDLALPEQDGFQLLALIRQDLYISTLCCVAITAYDTPELRHDAMANGFDGYFAKPLNQVQFLRFAEVMF